MSIMNGLYLGTGLLFFGVLAITVNGVLQNKYDRSKSQK